MTSASIGFEQHPNAFKVTLVGYGRYGRLIGNKYAGLDNNAKLWNLDAIVDPLLAEPQEHRDARDRCGGTELFDSFESWYSRYWSTLEADDKTRVVLDIAVKPDIVMPVVVRYIHRCSKDLKWVILPKPVTKTLQQLDYLIHLFREHQVRTAVASQWAYSPSPRQMAPFFQSKEVRFVEMEFSKENGQTYLTPPALLEVPHCIQLLHSTGCVDFHDTNPSERSPSHCTVEGSDWGVVVKYKLRNGVEVSITSDLDFCPTLEKRLLGNNSSRSDHQERTIKVMDGNKKLLIEADLWVHFDKTGNRVLRAGELKTDCNSSTIVEDQLKHMLNSIYNTFAAQASEDSALEDYEMDPSSYTLSNYRLIGKEVMGIEKEWEKRLNPASSRHHQEIEKTTLSYGALEASPLLRGCQTI